MKDAIIKRFNKGMLELTKYYRKLINKAKVIISLVVL